MGDNISKGERDELRRMVRSQFKVLRKEVQQRRQELVPAARMAELEAALGVSDADLIDPDTDPRHRWRGPDLGGPT